MLLTKRQRNEIFETLAAHGVDPQNCTLYDPASWYRPLRAIIVHQSRSHFRIKGSSDKPGIYVAVTRVGYVDQGRSSLAEWDKILERLAAWAQEVRYEAETPDLWAGLQQIPEILGAAQSADANNAFFTPDEQDEIARRFDEIENLVREQFELTTEQLSAFKETLDEVKEATTRVGRKDWIMVANGALLGLIVNSEVPPHVVQTVFNMLITGIGHIFGIGGPQPMITT